MNNSSTEIIAQKVPGRNGEPAEGLPAIFRAGEPVEEDGGTEQATSKRGPSQATRLVSIALGSGLSLFHTPAGEAFGAALVKGNRQVWPLGSSSSRLWLAQTYFSATGSTPSSGATQDALNVLGGRAIFDGPEEAVHVRIAEWHGGVVYDLGDATWRAVVVNAEGWQVVERSPVLFRRPAGMLAIPAPERGGSLCDLLPWVNIPEDSWPLLAAWIVQAAHYRGPYPVLPLSGEQGCGKSTLARILRRMLDPNVAELRSAPRDLRDLAIAAANSRVLVFDNLSGVSDWFSDGLCCLSTGGGRAYRRLFTDNEEVLFDAQRPVILTGIGDLGSRSDLLDRSLPLRLGIISPSERRPERDFWADFDAALPRIFGGLLDAVATALRRLDSARPDTLPRMADFAWWANAAEPAFGVKAGAFLEAYSGNRADANAVALEGSLAGMAALDFIRRQPESLDGCRRWEGTATELLCELAAVVEERTSRRKDWPKGANALSADLARCAPNLRAQGCEVTWGSGKGSRRKARVITLTFCEPADDPADDGSSANPQDRRQSEGSSAGSSAEKPSNGAESGGFGTFADDADDISLFHSAREVSREEEEEQEEELGKGSSASSAYDPDGWVDPDVPEELEVAA